MSTNPQADTPTSPGAGQTTPPTAPVDWRFRGLSLAAAALAVVCALLTVQIGFMLYNSANSLTGQVQVDKGGMGAMFFMSMSMAGLLFFGGGFGYASRRLWGMTSAQL